MTPTTPDDIILHGPSFAGYTKAVRLVLEEKGVPYRLNHFDFPGRPAGYEQLNPFGKVPVLQHGSFVLYEASAVARYVDEAFDGPPLQPTGVMARARMNQILSIMDQVGAPALLRTVYSGRFQQRVLRVTVDDAAITAALPTCERCLVEFQRILQEGQDAFLTGAELTIADLFVAPNLAYFCDTEEGEAMLGRHADLGAWLARMATRSSVARFGLPELPAPKHARPDD